MIMGLTAWEAGSDDGTEPAVDARVGRLWRKFKIH